MLHQTFIYFNIWKDYLLILHILTRQIFEMLARVLLGNEISAWNSTHHLNL